MSTQTSVLLAHFDPAERERLSRFLKDAGCRVTIAADGSEALELAAKCQPALVLVSCMLSGVSGFEVCRRLGAEAATAAQPVVLLADAEDPYVRARARHVGAKRVLVGSIVAGQLKELLASDWSAVDPLELSSRTAASGRGDRLFRDLAAGRQEGSEETLIAKVTDALTGLVNAEYLALKIEEECKRAARYGQPLSLLVAEVKSFDQLVEKYGRAVGDEALLEVAGVFLCESRDVDVAGRVGVARFHLLLPNTPPEGARIVARRIETNLAQRKVEVEGREVALPVRMGLACAGSGKARLSADELVRAADADLAAAALAPDGMGDQLRGHGPVEPVPPTEATPPPGRRPR